MDIEEIVQNCQPCMSIRNSPKSAALHPWIWATRPHQRIHIDYAEFKGQSLIIVNDSYSKWLEAIPVKSIISTNTVNKLRLLFASTGRPKEIVNDNGLNFHHMYPKLHPSEWDQAHSSDPVPSPIQWVCRAWSTNCKQGTEMQGNRRCAAVHGAPSSRLSVKLQLLHILLPECHLLNSFIKRQLRTRLSFIIPELGKGRKQSTAQLC
jgi:hypothetical protein